MNKRVRPTNSPTLSPDSLELQALHEQNQERQNPISATRRTTRRTTRRSKPTSESNSVSVSNAPPDKQLKIANNLHKLKNAAKLIKISMNEVPESITQNYVITVDFNIDEGFKIQIKTTSDMNTNNTNNTNRLNTCFDVKDFQNMAPLERGLINNFIKKYNTQGYGGGKIEISELWLLGNLMEISKYTKEIKIDDVISDGTYISHIFKGLELFETLVEIIKIYNKYVSDESIKKIVSNLDRVIKSIVISQVTQNEKKKEDKKNLDSLVALFGTTTLGNAMKTDENAPPPKKRSPKAKRTKRELEQENNRLKAQLAKS